MGSNDAAFGVSTGSRVHHIQKVILTNVGFNSICKSSYHLATAVRYNTHTNPQLETYYKLSYTIVSLIFLSPLVGYTLAAFLNHRIHNTLGQRGVALLGPGCHLIAYVVNCLHPPYPVLVVSFIFAGFGNGLEDAAWNAWIGNMANANEMLGLLHGVYGLGAVLAPLIATSMIARAQMPWFNFYYVMVRYVDCLLSLHAANSSVILNSGLTTNRSDVPSSSLQPAAHAFGKLRVPSSGPRIPIRSKRIKREGFGMRFSNGRLLV